jgi:CBS domain-containing protein
MTKEGSMYTNINVKQILNRKGDQVWHIDPEATILDALRYMAEKNVGALMVIDDGELVGIFSERDYARKVVLQGKNELNTQVQDVMTEEVIGVDLDQKIEECLVLMTGKFIRHLPVVKKDGEIAGVISIGDVVKEVIAEQSFMIDSLVDYITGEHKKPPLPDKSDVDIKKID